MDKRPNPEVNFGIPFQDKGVSESKGGILRNSNSKRICGPRPMNSGTCEVPSGQVFLIEDWALKRKKREGLGREK